MKFPRAAGVLLHPTSLPGGAGIGDLGPEAYRFVDFLQSTGQKIWQVLPLGPTGYGDSPYQCFSAFAGNPLLISPERLVESGLLDSSDLPPATDFPEDAVDFRHTVPLKYALLDKAFKRFQASEEYRCFCTEQAYWLDPFVRFQALKKANGGRAWSEWTVQEPDEGELERQRFWQFEFFRQWRELKAYANRRAIGIMGDIPIYVAGDSADVWANPQYFDLERNGSPRNVAGVPPDYFSATGQLWGNPVYCWNVMARDGFRWWIDRFRATFQAVDMVRLDHFRGFEAFWRVPATERTAVHGEWVKAPGNELFRAIQGALGELPIVAENLGVITGEVEALRHRFDFPGMSVLQFAFGTDPQAHTFLPHNYPREVVAYTGTHDNDTTAGWWTCGAGTSTRTELEVERERAFTKAYLGSDGAEIHWDFIRAVHSSVANTAIVPLQDVLGLGNEARMNMPGSTRGNWTWRFRPDALTPALISRLGQITHLYGR